MIRMSLSFPSTTLFRPVEIAVALPSGFCTARPPYRVLWALHCAMGSGNFFFENLDAAALVDKEHVAIVAPSLGNGYFINSSYEAQGDFLLEMLGALRDLLPLSHQRADNAVLGVSMGGFGAIRWALESGLFGSAASISGVFNSTLPPDERMLKKRAQRALYLTFEKTMRRMLLDAEERLRPEADLEYLLQKTEKNFPHIYLYCGEQDFLSLPHNSELEQACLRHNCPVRLRLVPGEHDLACWRGAFHAAARDVFIHAASKT